MEKVKVVPRVPRGNGNNKHSPIPCKHWFFTFNGYTQDDIKVMLDICTVPEIVHKYVFQEEKGESGNVHLQGNISFTKKKRPMSVFKGMKIHWEKTRNLSAAIEYCKKLDTRNGKVYTNIRVRKKIITLDRKDFYPWQETLMLELEKEPNDRTIWWIWDESGNVGKSAFSKYLCVHHHALILSGKGSDMKYGVIAYDKAEDVAPEIIILDIPRSNLNYVSYTGIEEVKGGCFFSPKYESTNYVMNSPHIVCFANEEPNKENMSLDKWKIIELD